jgi:hypothetical protein
MIRVRRGAVPLLAVIAGVAAVVGCMLPWETVVVRVPGAVHTRTVGSFHGSGLAACLGAALVLLMAADRLRRPSPSAIRDGAVAFAGALLAIGAALFTSTGGYPPVNAATYQVDLQPGLLLAGGGGLLLVLSVLPSAASRRGGSRSPASAAAPAHR